VRSNSTPSSGCAGGYAVSTKSRVRAGADTRMSTCTRNWGFCGSASAHKTFRGRKLDALSESWMPEIGPSSSMRGMWKRSHGLSIAAPPDERGGNSCDRPTATAPHLYSTSLGPLRPRKATCSAGVGGEALIWDDRLGRSCPCRESHSAHRREDRRHRPNSAG
jgi:hypothetical protein